MYIYNLISHYSARSIFSPPPAEKKTQTILFLITAKGRQWLGVFPTGVSADHLFVKSSHSGTTFQPPGSAELEGGAEEAAF